MQPMVAQVQQSVRDAWSGMLWIGVVVMAGVVVFVVAKIARRHGLDRQATLGTAFSLDQLRELRDRGELTIAEYEALKQKTIAAFTTKPTDEPTESRFDRSTLS